MSITLKAHQLAEQDINNYGAISRSDQELEMRAKSHVRDMQAHRPSPQAVLADDLEAFARLIVQQYTTTYKGLLVLYTGLREPFRMSLTPRYITSVNLDDSEDERSFTGFAGLQTIIRDAQCARRRTAEEDGESMDAYLLTIVQVTVHDTKAVDPSLPRCFICYTLTGDSLSGVFAREGVSDEVLGGLGLPHAPQQSSVMEERGDGA